MASKTPALAGEPYAVEYVVEWQGARDACIVLPLEAPQPEWGRAELKATRTERDGERWRVAQVVEYTVATPGKYAVAPLDVQVITANQPIVGVFDSTPSTPVKMEGVSMVVVAPSQWKWWGGLAGLFLLALGAMLIFLSHRKRTVGKPGLDQDVVVVSQELLHDARRCRLDGEFYPCYQSLLKSAEALQTVNIEAKNVADTVRARIPAVGFQGVRPTDDEMDGLFRDIERIIARRNSPPVSA